MHLRYLFIKLSLDIEHNIKSLIIQLITESDEDGYKIIEEYKGNLTWSEELNNEVNRLLNDYSDQRMIILLNDSQELLDIYVNDFDADTYINLSGDVLSKDMISNLK